MKALGLAAAAVAAAVVAVPLASTAQPPAGGRGGRGPRVQVDQAAMKQLFDTRCDSCHKTAERAPTPDVLRQRTADDIIDVLTNGVMKPMAAGIPHDQIVQLAVYVTGRQPGEALPVAINDKQCASDTPLSITPGSWTKIAGDDANTGFQKAPGLKAADVPKLKLKWALAFRASSYGQPIVVGDHLFMTSGQTGLYSFDARTGCLHWKNDKVGSRTTPMILHRPDLSPSGWVTFLSLAGAGDHVVAIDLQNGKELWRSDPMETVGASHLTGTPALWQDTLYVPVSGAEEGRSSGECCTFRGSLVALDAKTGKKKWQTYFITEPRTPTRKNRDGVQLQGPAGAASWSSPAIDIKRHQVIVTTGNGTTDAKTNGTDAVIAIDLTSGKTNWTTQTYPDDGFLVGCTRPPPSGITAPNCPLTHGPDYDYGASPIVVTVKGRDYVLTGQKSGAAHALDPKTGKRLWDNQVGTGSSLGGVEWGMATDGRYLFVANSDIMRENEHALQAAGTMDPKFPSPDPKPGLTAIDIPTGKTVWRYDNPLNLPCKWAPGTTHGREPGCFHGMSQAVLAIPGVVFAGSTNGWLRAYDSTTGKVVWENETTARRYDTVNGVKDQPGGSLDSMGPTVVNGVLYVMSGFAGSATNGSNNPNVLLAFSVDGK